MCVAGFDGTDTTSPLDQQAGGAATQPGSITPASANEVLICGFGYAPAEPSLSINGGFFKAAEEDYSSGNNMGCALAYLIQTSAAPANPTWAGTGFVDSIAQIISLKAASAGGSGAGSAAGTSTAAAVGAATDADVGAAAGTDGATAVGKATVAGVGSSAGTGAATAVGAETAAGVGTCAGTSTCTATAPSTIAAAGSAAGTSTALGVAGALGDWDYEPRRPPPPKKKKKPKEIFQTLEVINPSQGTRRRYQRDLDGWVEVFSAAAGDDDVLLAMLLLEP